MNKVRGTYAKNPPAAADLIICPCCLLITLSFCLPPGPLDPRFLTSSYDYHILKSIFRHQFYVTGPAPGGNKLQLAGKPEEFPLQFHFAYAAPPAKMICGMS